MADNIPTPPETPTVATQPLPTPFDNTQTSPDTFGAVAGHTLQQAGGLAAEIAETAKHRANLSAVLDARGQADNALNSQILDDSADRPDDQRGFRSLHGHDAMAASDKYIDNFNTTLQKIGTSLANGDQKRAFAQYAIGLKQEAFRHVQGHLAQQSNIVDADAYKTAQEALIGKLGAMPVAMDPNERARQMKQVELAARARAVSIFGKNATEDEIANFTIPARAKAVDQVLETLLAHEGAPGALNEAKRIIDDPATAALLGGARAALVQGRIYRRADQQEGLGWAQAAARANVILGTTIIDDKADENLNKLSEQEGSRPEMIKVARDEIQKFKVAGRQMQAQRNKSAFTSGVAAVMRGGPEDGAAYQKAIDVLSVPEAESGDLLERLGNFRSSWARTNANSPEVLRSQAAAEIAASDLLATTRTDTYGSAAGFLAQKMPDGRTLAESLSPQGSMKIGALFEKKKEKEAADKPLDGHAMGLVKSSLVEGLGFPNVSGVALTDDQIAQRNHVVDYVRAKRNAWKESNPQKEPGDEQYQEWINDQVGRVPSGHWYTSDRSRAEIELEQAKAAGAPPVAAASVAPAVPAAPAQPALAPLVPPAKAVRSYRYTPDRKKRAPVYNDGSQGPLEDSP